MASFLVGVLMGGPSAEHEISLASGRSIAVALGHSSHCVRPIIVAKDGAWMVFGKRLASGSALAGLDAVINALHGEWGEDGQVQLLLQAHGVPYTGSGPFASALAMDKWISRTIFKEHGLATPQSVLVTNYPGEHSFENASHILVKLPQGPWVVKPVSRGSSVGVSVVDEVSMLPSAFDHVFEFQDKALVEEYLSGMEVSCGVLEDNQGVPHALPVSEIIPQKNRYRFFDYDAKYSGETEEITPARIPSLLALKVQDAALKAYFAIGCRHYARVDMVIVENEPMVLELNTLPGLTPESILPKQVEAIGLSFISFLEHLLERTVRRT